MREQLAKEELEEKDIRITYYFTILFMAIGTALVLYILFQKTEKLTFFMIVLSLCSGGLPIGIIGAFIDYRLSEYKLKIRALE